MLECLHDRSNLDDTITSQKPAKTMTQRSKEKYYARMQSIIEFTKQRKSNKKCQKHINLYRKNIKKMRAREEIKNTTKKRYRKRKNVQP